MISTLRMVIEPLGPGAASIVPRIDGLTLIELVAGYEVAHGYSPAGGYAGIVPDHYRFGDLVSYFVGSDNGEWPRAGVIWLLGCACGEVGCWPLEALVRVRGDLIQWSDFRQPHRQEWDYTDFGPFTFNATQYRTAVRLAVETWRARTPEWWPVRSMSPRCHRPLTGVPAGHALSAAGPARRIMRSA